jgi:hypothetical protein
MSHVDDGLRPAAAPEDAALGTAPAEHLMRIRDLRLRVDAPEIYAAQCSCGWRGEEHRGRVGERLARQEGREHTERERLARYAPRPGARLPR